MGNSLISNETNQESTYGLLQNDCNGEKKYLLRCANFSLKHYQKIIEWFPGNILFSPFIVLSALAALTEGTKHNTAEELKKAMKMDGDDETNVTFTSFDLVSLSIDIGIGSYQGIPDATMFMANRIYIPEDIKVKEHYAEIMNPHYLAHQPIVQLKTLKSGSSNWVSRNEINDHVEEFTRSNIKDCIPEGSLEDDDQAVVLCAIYFMADWDTNFNVKDTYEGLFYREASKSISTTMMRMTAPLRYVNSSDFHCKMIRLNYGIGRLSMYIILPDEIEGLQALEEKLSSDRLTSLMAAMGEEKVNVKIELPKFQLDLGFSMKEVLKSIGINDLFSSAAADLSGISSREGLCVSDFYHKAVLDFPRETTEVKQSTLGFGSFGHSFKADHPFTFFIYDELSKLIIFIGHLIDPVTF